MNVLFNRNREWRQKNGEYTKLKDMSDSHLQYTLAGIKQGRLLGNPFAETTSNLWEDLITREIKFRENLRGATPEQMLNYILKENGWIE